MASPEPGGIFSGSKLRADHEVDEIGYNYINVSLPQSPSNVDFEENGRYSFNYNQKNQMEGKDLTGTTDMDNNIIPSSNPDSPINNFIGRTNIESLNNDNGSVDLLNNSDNRQICIVVPP